jgi:ADP-heptose:LPS heptosyltransferase
LGPASLASAAAALSLAECAVGHDSGPLHVAAGLGIPTVGVYAPGEPRRTFPQGTGPYRMVAHPSPASVTADEIVRAIDELLAETGSR